MKREIMRSANFAHDAAEYILQRARDTLATRETFRIALSGGNTPRPVYEEMAKAGAAMRWDRWLVTFGDERCVPPDDAQSNFRMARESLLAPAGVADQAVLRMRGEIDPPHAAHEYEERLDLIAAENDEAIYRHDLLLLGLGDDGHTASLFPESTALSEGERRVVANFSPSMQNWRITFTYPLINAAREVCFLVNNRKHADLVERVLAGDTRYPAARVQPGDGQITWILGT